MKTQKYIYQTTEALRSAVESAQTQKEWEQHSYELVENMSAGSMKEFAGVSSASDAMQLLQCGDIESAKKIHQAQEKFSDGEHTARRVFERSTVGCLPNIPAYLLGLPKQMYNVRVQYSDTPTLKIYVDTTVCSAVSAEDMSEAGAKISSCVKAIEAQDIRVSLYAVAGMCRLKRNDSHIICTCIKKAESPLNLLNMAFCLINPAFLRIVCLMHLQRYYSHYVYGHGSVMNFQDIEKEFPDGCCISLQNIIREKQSIAHIAERINKYLRR